MKIPHGRRTGLYRDEFESEREMKKRAKGEQERRWRKEMRRRRNDDFSEEVFA